MRATSRAFDLRVLVGFLVLAPLAYANVLNSFFLSDDFVHVARLAAGDFSPVYARSQGGLLRPLFAFSHFLDLKLWGLRPLGFHLTNVALHASASFLTYALASRLLQNSPLSDETRRRSALSAGLIFLLHPSHTEAVTWNAGRADLLATVFSLLALVFLVARARGAGRTTLAASLLSFALALLGKESAVCVPLAAFVVGTYESGEDRVRGRLARGFESALPFAAVLALYVAARALVLGALVGGYGAGRHLNFKHSVVVSQLLRYPLRALLPAGALQSPLLESHALSLALLAAGVALAAAATFTLARARARRALFARLRAAAPLWLMVTLFFVCLAPVINLRINVFDTQGERYLYLSSAFSSMAVAYLLARLLARRHRVVWLASLACVLGLYSAGLWGANRTWAEASELARAAPGDLTASAGGRGTIYVLNAPDNLRGAHLFRNGLPEAARLFGPPGGPTDVRVLSFHALRTARDGATLSRDGDAYTLRLADDDGGSTATTFERVDAAPPCVELLERAPRTLRFRLAGCPETVAIFYFAEGRMRLLSPAPPTT